MADVAGMYGAPGAAGAAMRATAAEVCRNFGHWQDRAMLGPVLVTNHGRAKTVLLSADAWAEGPVAGRAERQDGEATILLDRMTEAYLDLDDALRLRRANRAAAIALRVPADGLPGAGIGELFPAMATAAVERVLMRVMVTGEPRSFEVPSGGCGSPTLAMRAFPTGTGVGLFFALVADDPAARDAMLRMDALEALLAAHGRAGFAMLSPRGTFSTLCPAFAAMLGFEADRMAGVRLVDVVAIGQRGAVADAVEAVLGRGENVAMETALLSRRGDEPLVTVALTPVRSAYAIDGAALLVTPPRSAGGGGCAA